MGSNTIENVTAAIKTERDFMKINLLEGNED
jgi:hypothetical protein